MEEGDVLTKGVSKTFQATLSHTIVGQILIGLVIVKAVDIGRHSFIARCKAGVRSISRQNLVITDSSQYVVETTELFVVARQETLNRLTCKRIKV